jgi:hypothetical protein
MKWWNFLSYIKIPSSSRFQGRFPLKDAADASEALEAARPLAPPS